MGAFICNNCNESLNKLQQIKKHLIKCKNYLFTCIDCQQIIKYKNVRLHLNCVGGREKQVGIVNYIAMANKQDNKVFLNIRVIMGDLEGIGEKPKFCFCFFPKFRFSFISFYFSGFDNFGD
ncbi:unnamed protein product [Meloidogyne enterolobii]|uniref:Uncharacterized protein n=1 Tax=Meloidogyne enterolobii TaxID=390850 RepID=A0ACB1A3D0_MELEN